MRQLRINCWENLAFFRGIEKIDGHVETQPDADVDGTACYVLNFVHADGSVFSRYFAKDTGRLIKTVTDNKREIREEGEIMVNGIHFPKRFLNKLPNGQNSTVTIDAIKLNEDLPPEEFAVPMLAPNR